MTLLLAIFLASGSVPDLGGGTAAPAVSRLDLSGPVSRAPGGAQDVYADDPVRYGSESAEAGPAALVEPLNGVGQTARNGDAGGLATAPQSVPVEKVADAFASDLFWLATGTSGDLFSTAAFRRWCPVCVEGNPLGWDSEARVALKVGTGTMAAALCWKLRRSGHPVLASIVRWAVFGAQAFAVVVNSRHAILHR